MTGLLQRIGLVKTSSVSRLKPAEYTLSHKGGGGWHWATKNMYGDARSDQTFMEGRTVNIHDWQTPRHNITNQGT